MKILYIKENKSDPRFNWEVKLLFCGQEKDILVRDREHLLERLGNFDKFPSATAVEDYLFDIRENHPNTL